MTADLDAIPFTPVVPAGPFLFLSGQIALDETRKVVKGGVAAETKRIFAQAAALMAQHECELKDVVKCTVWLADLAEFGDFNAAYLEAFGGHKPARSTVEARLAFGARVEIEFVALRKMEANSP